MSATTSFVPRHIRSNRAINSLNIATRNPIDLIEEVERGLSVSTLERFSRATGLSVSRIAQILRLPARTLLRRKARGRLGMSESERLLRLATIFDKAAALFEGDRKAALMWLQTPQRALAGREPLQLIRSEIGAREVEDLIGRLEHGVFA